MPMYWRGEIFTEREHHRTTESISSPLLSIDQRIHMKKLPKTWEKLRGKILSPVARRALCSY
jgi:hypothetical protein